MMSFAELDILETETRVQLVTVDRRFKEQLQQAKELEEKVAKEVKAMEAERDATLGRIKLSAALESAREAKELHNRDRTLGGGHKESVETGAEIVVRPVTGAGGRTPWPSTFGDPCT